MRTLPDNKHGFALLMVILLLALLSGVVVQSLISVRMSLRDGDAQQARLALRASAMDASWSALRIGMKAGSTSADFQEFEDQLPSGIHTKTTLRGLERTTLPAPFQRANVPLFGQFFSVTSLAEFEGKTDTARALACRLPSGDVRLLAWVETP